MEKARLHRGRQARPGDPAEQGKELAAIADPQGKGIRALIELGKHLLQAGVEEDGRSPAFCRFRHIGVGKTADCRQSTKAAQIDSAVEQITHRHIPGGKTGSIEGGGHLPVGIGAFVTENRHLWLVQCGEQLRRRRLGSEAEPVYRAATIKVYRLFGFGTGRVDLQPFELVAGLLPPVAEQQHRLIENRHPIAGHPDLRGFSRCADIRAGYFGSLQHPLDFSAVFRTAFDDQAKFLAKEHLQGVCLALQGNFQTTIAAEGHLQQGGDQPTIAAVVPGQEQAAVDQLLHCDKSAPHQCAVFDVRALLPDPAKHLGKGAAPQPAAPAAEIDVEQREALPFEIRGDGPSNVDHRGIGRDHQLPGGLDRLPIDHGGHRQAVFAAVHRQPHLNHQIAHRPGGIVESRPFPGKLRRPHPVGRTFDLLRVGNPGKDQIGQRLAHRHPCSRYGADEHLDRLFTDGGGNAGQPQVALRHHRDIADRQLQRATALLAGHQAGHRPVNLTGQKTFRAHRNQAQHIVQGSGNRQPGRDGQRPLGQRPALVGKGLLRNLAEQGRQVDIHRA